MRAARFIAAARWRGGSVAACGARAAERAGAARRRAHRPRRGRSRRTVSRRGVPSGAAAIGLDRGPQRASRRPLGCRQCRRFASTRRAGRARARRHPGQRRRSCGALLQATRTVPIVFAVVADPVGAGFVDSLARPGGNATGFSNYEYGIGGNGWSCSKRSRLA